MAQRCMLVGIILQSHILRVAFSLQKLTLRNVLEPTDVYANMHIHNKFDW